MASIGLGAQTPPPSPSTQLDPEQSGEEGFELGSLLSVSFGDDASGYFWRFIFQSSYAPENCLQRGGRGIFL